MDLKVLFELRNIKISEIEQYSMQDNQKESIKSRLYKKLNKINKDIAREEERFYK